ncbi:MAG: hypothetical protein ACRCTQ_04525 [Brevinemataceae bacterium]
MSILSIIALLLLSFSSISAQVQNTNIMFISEDQSLSCNTPNTVPLTSLVASEPYSTRNAIPQEFQNPNYLPLKRPALIMLPEETRMKIKQIVNQFALNKQKVFLELRPALESVIYNRDTLRLELSSILEQPSLSEIEQQQANKLILQIKQKEQEIINLEKSEKQNIESLRKTMHNQITETVNQWLVSQVRVSSDFLAPLLYEAEKNYDYLSENR